MPAAAPFAPIIGAGTSFLLPKLFGGDEDERYDQASGNVQAMSRAELEEAQRIADLNQQMQDIFMGRYQGAQGNVDALDLRKIFGGEYAGLAGEMLPGKFANDALMGLMGMTGDVGGGSVNAEANRGFLDTQANTQAASGAVSGFVNSLLDLADRDMGDGNYTSPGYDGGAPQASQGIAELPVSTDVSNVPPNPFTALGGGY